VSAAASPAAHARPAAPAPEPARAGGRRVPFGRALAALVLPLSMVPVVLLAPSLFRAPVVLARHAAHALAPAHHRAVRHPREGPLYYLVGPARLEIETFEAAAGAMTPKVGVSPLNEPEWAARAAAEAVGSEQPSVLLARGRETTDATGRPLR
jgi:hypothetical protein